MALFDWLKRIFGKSNNVEHLSENPTSDKFTFINDLKDIRAKQVEEYKTWYVGDSSELLNYYTNREISGNASDPLFYRNKDWYFWGISSTETTIKRVHSGLPKVIIDTLCNVIGQPEIKSEDVLINEKLAKILENNTFDVILNQQARPLTLVEGWGAFKVNFDKTLSNTPIIQYYEATDVEFDIQKGIITGIAYKDYYKKGNKNYMIVESRVNDKDGCKIRFNLFELLKDKKCQPVPLNTLEETAELPEDGFLIPNTHTLLGVPCKYYFDVNNKGYGRSIFQGKLDIFDDLDQSLSQRSQTCRVSTPVEYFPEDVLEHGANGQTILPSTYNRQFLKKPTIPDGDGSFDSNIQTTQPVLNFEMYNNEQLTLIKYGCVGIVSPATLGFDLSAKDNAEAQREKEKVTIMTRNNVISMETSIIKKLCNIVLMLQEYMDTGVITTNDYDISVKYNEFANPSFESLSNVLSPMYANGTISTEMYVSKLYGDALSDEEKAKEIEWLEQKAKQDNLEMGDFDLNGIDTQSVGEDSIE